MTTRFYVAPQGAILGTTSDGNLIVGNDDGVGEAVEITHALVPGSIRLTP